MTLQHLTGRRVLIAAVTSSLCCWGIWQAARVGIARQATRNATVTNLAALDRAVRLSPTDAETHFARGDVLQRTENNAEAKIEFERAVQLRPRDYFLWLVLGVTRDADRDQAGALLALRQSALLAPAYAQPRWQLGNLLLRMGEVDHAFVEFRKAAQGDPTILPVIIDLAWNLSHRDPKKVAVMLQPDNDSTRLALALFLAKHSQGPAAVEQFLLTKTTSDEKSQALLEELLKDRAFSDAYPIWARMHGVPVTNPGAAFFDGGFEGWLASGDEGFGWQIAPNIANVEMSVDTSERHSGGRSLHAAFRGNSNPAAPLLSQLILVKPQTNYQITFAALTKDFVSAAGPILTVSDASDPKGVTLAQSPPLLPDKTGWRSFTVDLTTNAATQAIRVSVARQKCANDPCPAFGSLWLDSFSIQGR